MALLQFTAPDQCELDDQTSEPKFQQVAPQWRNTVTYGIKTLTGWRPALSISIQGNSTVFPQELLVLVCQMFFSKLIFINSKLKVLVSTLND